MNIAFNMSQCGLGNNGGTRTIIKCAEALETLGHRCNIISAIDNFTWFEHRQPVNFLPHNTDVVINIAAVDYKSTLSMPVEKKFAWWRAHESWSTPESTLMELYKDERIKNIVNSKGLQRLLTSYGAESKLVYQGIDFDWWGDRKLRPKDKIRIGCLYTKQPRKRWKDFVKLANILGHDGYEYISVGNVNPQGEFLTRSWVNVDHDELCDAYSSCHIWFAPTASEGLHNVPMEANLCGCLVVCGDEPLNGMIYDYAFPNDTAMVYNRKDIKHAAELIRNPNWKLIGNMQKYLKHYIGTRKSNMKKMIQYLKGI